MSQVVSGAKDTVRVIYTHVSAVSRNLNVEVRRRLQTLVPHVSALTTATPESRDRRLASREAMCRRTVSSAAPRRGVRIQVTVRNFAGTLAVAYYLVPVADVMNAVPGFQRRREVPLGSG